MERDDRVQRNGAAGREIRDGLEDLFFGVHHLVNTISGGSTEADELLRELETSFVDALYSLRHYEEELEKTREALKALEASYAKAGAPPKEGG